MRNTNLHPSRSSFQHKGTDYHIERLPPGRDYERLSKIMLTDGSGNVHGEFIDESGRYVYKNLYNQEGFPLDIIKNILIHLNKDFHPIKISLLNTLKHIDINNPPPRA